MRIIQSAVDMINWGLKPIKTYPKTTVAVSFLAAGTVGSICYPQVVKGAINGASKFVQTNPKTAILGAIVITVVAVVATFFMALYMVVNAVAETAKELAPIAGGVLELAGEVAKAAMGPAWR